MTALLRSWAHALGGEASGNSVSAAVAAYEHAQERWAT
jgi:hypothetical protein